MAIQLTQKRKKFLSTVFYNARELLAEYQDLDDLSVITGNTLEPLIEDCRAFLLGEATDGEELELLARACQDEGENQLKYVEDLENRISQMRRLVESLLDNADRLLSGR